MRLKHLCPFEQKFNDALIISEDARIEDALAYLNEFFSNVKNGPYTELEKQLTAKFQGISHSTCDSCRAEEGLWMPAALDKATYTTQGSD